MHDIRARLLQVEDDLLSAISNNSLDEFQRQWAELSDDLAAAVQVEQLPDTVSTLAYTVANRVHAITSAFLDLDEKYQELTTSFLREADDVLKRDQSLDSHSTSAKLGLPPYIPLAYAWLLDNLHCPYPSASMRDSLAKESGSTRKAIDAWFVDVRKRIGWNTLRRTRFAGKKDDIIRAATLFFRKNGGDSSLASEFASMEVAARELYAEKLRPSAFGSRFAEAVDALDLKKADKQGVSVLDQSAVYPSPRSCSSSLPPSPVILSLQSFSKPAVPVSKRARSVDEEIEGSTRSSFRERPSKRQRLDSRLPSPTPSLETPEPPTRPRHRSRQGSPSKSPSTCYQPDTSQFPIRRHDSRIPRFSRETETAGIASEAGGPGRQSITALPDAALTPVPSGISPEACSSVNQIEQSPVVEPSQANHRRRCVSEAGLQFPNALRNKLPRAHSVSDSLSTVGSGNASGWSFDPEILQSVPAFDSLDDSTACEVTTFDFSTYSPQTLCQTKESLPIQPSVLDVEAIFPPADVTPNPFIVSPSLNTFDNTGLSNEGFLSLLDFLPQDSFLPEASLSILSASSVANETNPNLGSDLVNVIPNANDSFNWSVSSGVEDIFGSMIQPPSVSQELESTAGILSQDEKSKKLRLLAELKEATHRLEAELGVL